MNLASGARNHHENSMLNFAMRNYKKFLLRPNYLHTECNYCDRNYYDYNNYNLYDRNKKYNFAFMISNPFIISGKVVSRYFCDREKESAELIRRITNGQNLVLISPRRMGKTGLIEYCFDNERIRENYQTFYIDILQTNTFSELIFLLGKEIFNSLVPRGLKIAKGFVQAIKSLSGRIEIDTITGEPSFNIQLGNITKPEITLDEIFGYLERAKMRCIVAIDEFQQISNYPEKNVEAVMRSHIQRSSNCNFIFSGSERHILQEMFMSSARPFFNSATFMHLGPIPRGEYVDFIVRLFKERDKTITAEHAAGIYDKFEGYTYNVQRVCNESFSLTNEGEECSREVIDRAVDSILDTYSVIYQEMLSQLPMKQKQLLYSIATEGKVEGLTSEEFIKRHALTTASSVQSSARLLIKKDHLIREGNVYSLSDKFLQFWIRRMLTR